MNQPVILLPEEIFKLVPRAKFLSGDNVEAYKESVERLCKDSGVSGETVNRVKETLKLNNVCDIEGKFAYSNPFIQVHAKPILTQAGLVPITRPDLDLAAQRDDFFLENCYTDFGVVLRTKEDSYALKDGTKPNDLLARILAEELESIGMDLSQSRLVHTAALRGLVNGNSYYGLLLKLSEKGKDMRGDLILNADDFHWDGKRDEGLACACFLRGRYWYSVVELLAGANGGGRVVGKTAVGGAREKLEAYRNELRQEEAKELELVKIKYKRAQDLLEGKE